MQVIEEVELRNFKFWSGAKENIKLFTDSELEQIEFMLEDIFPEGIDATRLNDIFWFEMDWLAEMVDTTEDELYRREQA